MSKFESIEFQDIPEKAICSRIYNALVPAIQKHLNTEQAEALGRCILIYCKYADHQHEESSRVFAHTFHKDWCICVSRSINNLEPQQILGILIHEIGHFLGGRSEHEADRFIRDLGFKVEYRGKTSIQYMDYSEIWARAEWRKITGSRKRGDGDGNA